MLLLAAAAKAQRVNARDHTPKLSFPEKSGEATSYEIASLKANSTTARFYDIRVNKWDKNIPRQSS
jgi:hypothetical protein